MKLWEILVTLAIIMLVLAMLQTYTDDDSVTTDEESYLQHDPRDQIMGAHTAHTGLTPNYVEGY